MTEGAPREVAGDDDELDVETEAAGSVGPTLGAWAPRVTLGLALGLLGTNAIAYRPAFAGRLAFYAWAVLPWLVAAVVAAVHAGRRGVLRRWLTPRPGDFTLGALLGGLLVIGVWLARNYLLAHIPAGNAWLFSVYVQLGDARAFEALVPSLGLAVAGASYELVLHGYAQETLEELAGPRLAYPGVLALSAALWIPSTISLAEPGGGRNPLFLAAAVFSALLLGALRRVTGRLTPGIVARVVFLYFTVAQFRLPGL